MLLYCTSRQGLKITKIHTITQTACRPCSKNANRTLESFQMSGKSSKEGKSACFFQSLNKKVGGGRRHLHRAHPLPSSEDHPRAERCAWPTPRETPPRRAGAAAASLRRAAPPPGRRSRRSMRPPPKLKGSIGEGSNHSNFSHQSSVKILSKVSTFARKFKNFRIVQHFRKY